MLQKPPACSGCVLETIGGGFAPAVGPATASVLFVGESLGYTEAQTGVPFCGDAGGMLAKLFTLGSWDRTRVRIHNTINCRPPGDDLSRFPAAIDHCSPYLDESLASPYLKVVVPMGGTALKRVLHLSGKKVGPENFHGTVTRDPFDRFWVVPTYHPSFLQRGAHNLIGTVLWDLAQAKETELHGRKTDEGSLVVDPPLEWFTLWVSTVLQAAQQDPTAYPVSVDVETPDKAHGKDEGEISAEDRSYQILRVNVSCHPEEGITVPFVGGYVDQITRLLHGPQQLFLWNKAYDIPRLIAAGTTDGQVEHRALDLMWLWHYLQSDLPRGLGFVAPFYSGFGAWKHLADSDPARYGAIDGLQTHRVGFGILGDLQRLGMYGGALRHVHALHHLALQPAQSVGVRIDRERLLLFKADLGEKATSRLAQLQSLIPAALKPLSPKGGLTKRPADNVLHVKATAFTRKGKERKGKPASEIKLDLYKQAEVVERELTRDVLVCRTCGAVEVQRRHRCKPAEAGALVAQEPPQPSVALEPRTVVRWFWQEPFNPDSWQQVLAYIHWKKHLPGKAKKTHKDSTDRETLERLTRTGDPFYALLLDYRAVQKVKGTYVDGTERRLDAEDRIHPEPTFKPSTMRLSYRNPNVTNVVQDRGGKESLAAGFRRCVVAGPDCRLLEVDFAGSEAVDVGWLSRDPGYIRLAKLGVHAGLASHILGRPYNPTWGDAELGEYFREIKKSPDPHIHAVYDRAKRYVHGCVTPEHEVLTSEGWVRVDQIADTTPIAQWQNGTLSWVVPSQWTRAAYDGELIALHGRALSAILTPNHRVLHRYSGQAWRTFTAETLPAQGRIPTQGVLAGEKVADADVLRLAVAIQADAAVQRSNVVFTLSKLRKIQRLKELLVRLEISYREVRDPARPEVVRIRLEQPGPEVALGWLTGPEKTFDLGGLLRLRADLREAWLDELPYWDGTRLPQQHTVYRSTNQRNVEIAQTVAASVGRQALVRTQPPHVGGYGTKVLWIASFNQRQETRAEALTRKRVRYTGTVYCPTVPSGFFLVRHQHRIHVTGNSSYGLTIPGMTLQFPETFPTRKIAEEYAEIFRQMAPAIPAWQQQTREIAAKQHYLGGPGAHPFGYKHWFWSVYTFKKITSGQYWAILGKWKRAGRAEGDCPVTIINGQYFKIGLGEDGKRCIAFMPQSITAGKLKEAMLRLFDRESPSYIGEAYYGRTPLRAPIHDSLLLEIPKANFEMVASLVVQEMQRPVPEMPCPAAWGMGEALSTGVSAKVGSDWGEMEALAVGDLGVGADTVATVALEEETEDLSDFGRSVA